MEEKSPIDLVEKRRIINKIAHVTVIGEELYNKSLQEGSPLKIYVSEEEGEMIKKSIHEEEHIKDQGIWQDI